MHSTTVAWEAKLRMISWWRQTHTHLSVVLGSPAHVELLHSSFLLLLFPFLSSWFPLFQMDSLEASPAC